MGNHEYCIDCGESNFHDICDPVKYAKHQAKKQAEKERTERGRAKVRQLAKRINTDYGVKVEINEYGHAEIKWWDVS